MDLSIWKTARGATFSFSRSTRILVRTDAVRSEPYWSPGPSARARPGRAWLPGWHYVQEGHLCQGPDSTLGPQRVATRTGGSTIQISGLAGAKSRVVWGSDQRAASTRARSLEHVGIHGAARRLRQLVQLHLLRTQHFLPPQHELL